MLNQLKFNSNEYLPLRDVVFNTLRQAIITGEFAPGERLMEIALAERLGVSRTPVREAIRKLELEGLVTMIPRRGAEVAQITEKNLKDVLEVRRALDAVTEAGDALLLGMTLDAVTVSLEGALSALMELTGERVSDAVVDSVFERFCVGK